MNTKVEQIDIDIDEMFAGAATADNIISEDDAKKDKPNIFSKPDKVDMSFLDPDKEEEEEDPKPDSEEEEEDENKKPDPAKQAKAKEEGSSILDSLDEEESDEEDEEDLTKQKRGRKKIEGISDVFSKLIESEKIIPFDDDKPLEEYSAKDWEELIEANIKEAEEKARQEAPQDFFNSLPDEILAAYDYVAKGGKDLKGFFYKLAESSEVIELDASNPKHQEKIIKEYLTSTGFGTEDEIEDEIEVWKDLGKLEQQALKFQPKLQKLKEKEVQKELQKQELLKKQREQDAQQYMVNVYETLKEGKIGEVKLDKKTQAMLYNGLIKADKPSVTGRNTNLLGHLLEKYQFVEPNYSLIAEALWLLSDPGEYKKKIMELGSAETVKQTVRSLKTEQANNSKASMGIPEDDETKKIPSKRKIQRSNNIFRRF